MTDLQTGIRDYYRSLIEPITVAEVQHRRATGRSSLLAWQKTRRPATTLLVVASATIVLVGSVLIVAAVFSVSTPVGTQPPPTPHAYEYSGDEWIGFEFTYPGHGTDLEERSAARTLVDTDRFPFAEWTLLHLEGRDNGAYLDVIWISEQTGHGSVVRDALVVASSTTNPQINIHCDGPAIVLTEQGGGPPVKAWSIGYAPLRIKDANPASIDCGT